MSSQSSTCNSALSLPSTAPVLSPTLPISSYFVLVVYTRLIFTHGLRGKYSPYICRGNGLRERKSELISTISFGAWVFSMAAPPVCGCWGTCREEHLVNPTSMSLTGAHILKARAASNPPKPNTGSGESPPDPVSPTLLTPLDLYSFIQLSYCYVLGIVLSSENNPQGTFCLGDTDVKLMSI
jgi:hypothetical protein